MGEAMERRDKINYYLDLAEVVSKRSTCLRRAYGAVIVKNDEVIATGYVGAPLVVGERFFLDDGITFQVAKQVGLVPAAVRAVV